MFGCDLKTGGESGIRTHVTLSSKHAFQACAFSHSALSPAKPGKDDSGHQGYRLAPCRLKFTPTRQHFILRSGAHKRKAAGNKTAGRMGTIRKGKIEKTKIEKTR